MHDLGRALGDSGISEIGPLRLRLRCSDTSAVGAHIVNVRPQPRHASLVGGGPRHKSGSLAMFATMCRAGTARTAL
jgi:hypothetical protein